MSIDYDKQMDDQNWRIKKRNTRGGRHQFTVYLNLNNVTKFRKFSKVALSEMLDNALEKHVAKLEPSKKCPNCNSIRFVKAGGLYRCKNPSCKQSFEIEKIEGVQNDS